MRFRETPSDFVLNHIFKGKQKNSKNKKDIIYIYIYIYIYLYLWDSSNFINHPQVIPGGFMAGMQKGPPHLVRFCESSMGSSWSSKASAWILEPASAGKCPTNNGGFGKIMGNSEANLGKSTINDGFNGRRIHGGCSIATFDYERVYTSQFMFNRLNIEYYRYYIGIYPTTIGAVISTYIILYEYTIYIYIIHEY